MTSIETESADTRRLLKIRLLQLKPFSQHGHQTYVESEETIVPHIGLILWS